MHHVGHGWWGTCSPFIAGRGLRAGGGSLGRLEGECWGAYLCIPAVGTKSVTRLHRRATIGTLLRHEIILASKLKTEGDRLIIAHAALQGFRMEYTP